MQKLVKVVLFRHQCMIIRMDLDMTVHKKGVEAIRGTMAHDMGVLTTPQLHWMVRSFNNGVPASE